VLRSASQSGAGAALHIDVAALDAPAGVILALSGDGPRTETAVDLWRRQYAPIIIFAGASEDPTWVASGQLMKRAIRSGSRRSGGCTNRRARSRSIELAKLSVGVASTAFH
jgi:hypothetical protein